MPNYRRLFIPGGTYFFTVVTYKRRPLLTDPLTRDCLHMAIAEVRTDWSFDMPAMVLLPDHLHTIWTLPEGDSNYPIRWSLIKRKFTQLYLQNGGGHLVSLAATLGDGPFPRTGGWEKQPNTIRGVISLSGPYDLEKLSWGTLWKPASGDPRAARKIASPIKYVSAKTTAILILHSDNDGSVPVQQARDMAAALEKAKARHRLSIYKNKGHMRITDDVIKESRAFIEDIGKWVSTCSGL